MAFVEFKDVRKIYTMGEVQVAAVDGMSFEIEQGELVVVVGPSGSGKTTLLNMMGGMDSCTSGSITLDGARVDQFDEKQLTDYRRYDIGFVFQFYNLVQNLTALENVELASQICRNPLPPADVLTQVGLAHRMDNFPAQLSGGEQQRVAIARAIVSEPRLLLLDEPLSNLDAKLRVDMRAELKRLHHETGTTIIYVTHDQVEALTMSTRIALYRKGELVQVAPPLELYDNPVNLYTADFIGNPSINFVKGTAQVEAGGMRVDSPLGQLGFERGDMTEAAPQSGSVDVTIGVRPEQLSISRQADDAHWVEGHVYSGMPAGSETLVSVRVGDTMLTVKELGSTHYASDEPVYLGFNPKKVNVFETKSENLIKYCV